MLIPPFLLMILHIFHFENQEPLDLFFSQLCYIVNFEVIAMDVVIREAVITDWRELNRLNSEELGYLVSESQTKEQLTKILADETQLILIAMYHSTVQGYVHLSNYETLYFPTLKNVMGLAVSSHFQGKSLGSQLMSAAELWAKKQGASGIRVNSGEMRIGAHKFYEKIGYKSKKMQKNFFKQFY